MEPIYDLVIVGSGPAGLAAGIYAARAELKMIILEKEPVNGGQIVNTYEIENYPGIPDGSGYDLAEKFRIHCDQLGVEFKNCEVEKVTLENDIKVLTLAEGEQIRSKTIVFATGTQYRKLGVKGEEELSGLGVSYCATCDGAFFRNRITVVVGGGDAAVEDAVFLSRLCKKVYVIHRRSEFKAAKTLVRRLKDCNNVEIIWNNVIEEICGEDMVEEIVIQNVNTKEIRHIAANGIFIAIGNLPNSQIIQNMAETDAQGYVKASEDCKTSVSGIFAAGDVRTKQLRQVVTAASDGANAITSVERYLNESENR